jgi:hypothetical protein
MLSWDKAPHDVRWAAYRERSPDVPVLSARLKALLDALDDHVGGKLYVHRTYDGGGTSGQHPLGRAFDGRVEGMDLLAQFITITRFPWGGLGLYGPDVWNNPGFHVDVREQLPQARWCCVLREGRRSYEALTPAHLRAVCRREARGAEG